MKYIKKHIIKPKTRNTKLFEQKPKYDMDFKNKKKLKWLRNENQSTEET